MRYSFFEDAAKKKSGVPDDYRAYYIGIEGVPKSLKNSTKVSWISNFGLDGVVLKEIPTAPARIVRKQVNYADRS